MNIYSCFEKGRLTIGEKFSRQMSKVITSNSVFFTVA